MGTRVWRPRISFGALAFSLLLVGSGLLALSPATVEAHGYGHGHGHGGFGIHYGRGRHRGHVHRSFGLSYYGPLYFPRYYEPAPRVVYESAPVTVIRHASRPLPDMPRLFYYPNSGQSEEQQTLDRQECERWAWRQTSQYGSTGAVRTTRTIRYGGYGYYPDNPIAPAASGAALGALGGAIAGDAGAGAAVGAVVGAASWFLGALTAPPVQPYEQVVEEYVAPSGPDPDELRRALSACMEGRGYTVR